METPSDFIPTLFERATVWRSCTVEVQIHGWITAELTPLLTFVPNTPMGRYSAGFWQPRIVPLRKGDQETLVTNDSAILQNATGFLGVDAGITECGGKGDSV